MRLILLSALFALGVGVVGTNAASAAPVGGLSKTLTANSLLSEAQVYIVPPRRYRRPPVRCRNVRVCRYTSYGRRLCRYERICYRR